MTEIVLEIKSCMAGPLSWLAVQDGALELEGGELSFETGPDGKPRKVEGKAHLPMMAVVAEMMIFANAAVAHRIAGAFPGAALLRRHAPPRPDGFEQVFICAYKLPVHLQCFVTRITTFLSAAGSVGTPNSQLCTQPPPPRPSLPFWEALTC